MSARDRILGKLRAGLASDGTSTPPPCAPKSRWINRLSVDGAVRRRVIVRAATAAAPRSTMRSAVPTTSALPHSKSRRNSPNWSRTTG